MSQYTPAFPPQQPIPTGQQPAQQQPVAPQQHRPFRILGFQPVLFVGMIMMIGVTLLTIVLVLTGDIGEQGPRVVWTVVAFIAFTGLLALDMLLGRKSQTPLTIGVVANIYMLFVLMIATWVVPPPSDEYGSYDWDRDYAVIALFGVYLGTIVVVRVVALIAWGLIVLGKRIESGVALVTGYVAAGIWGISGVLLTLPFVFSAFGIELGEAYWRVFVITLILGALVTCILVLQFFNRRNVDYEDKKAAGLLDVPKQQASFLQPQAQQPQAWAPQHMGYPNPAQQAQPLAQQPLLPWPLLPDGRPYPAGPDGQPINPT